MLAMTMRLLFLLLLGLFAVGITPAAFADDISAQNQDWRAAKAMTDDELDQVSAGLQMINPLQSYNFVNIGWRVKVATTPVATKVRVGHSIKIRRYNLNFGFD